MPFARSCRARRARRGVAVSSSSTQCASGEHGGSMNGRRRIAGVEQDEQHVFGERHAAHVRFVQFEAEQPHAERAPLRDRPSSRRSSPRRSASNQVRSFSHPAINLRPSKKCRRRRIGWACRWAMSVRTKSSRDCCWGVRFHDTQLNLVVLTVGVVVAAPASGRSRRRRASSARPATGRAWRGSCAPGARALRRSPDRSSRPRRRNSC